MEIPTDIQHKLLTEFQLLTIESASDDDEDSPKALGEDEDDTMTFDDVRRLQSIFICCCNYRNTCGNYVGRCDDSASS